MATDIDKTTKAKVLASVLVDYEAAQWQIPEDFLEYSHFERVVKDLDFSSSPGYPYLLTTSTNRAFFEADSEGNPSLAAMGKVWQLVNSRIANGGSDPIRLFIKPEPISKKKSSEGRYRLISSVSIIDQIVDHMLFGDMNKQVTKNYLYVPAKVGWSQYGGGWRVMPFHAMCAIDKSAWDWTAQLWVLMLELEVRKHLCTNLTPEWVRLAEWRYRELFVDCLFVLSSGHFLKQLEPGVMKSGCVSTIVTNSIAQGILHYVACLETEQEPEDQAYLGDDVLTKEQKDMMAYLAALAKYCIIKQYLNAAEFGGMRFEYGGVVEPLYTGKHCYVLRHVDPAIVKEIVASYSLLYHRSSRKRTMKLILSELGIPPPDLILDIIYDGE